MFPASIGLKSDTKYQSHASPHRPTLALPSAQQQGASAGPRLPRTPRPPVSPEPAGPKLQSRSPSVPEASTSEGPAVATAPQPAAEQAHAPRHCAGDKQPDPAATPAGGAIDWDEKLAQGTPACLPTFFWALIGRKPSPQAALAKSQESPGREPWSPALLAALREIRGHIVAVAAADGLPPDATALTQALHSRMRALEAAFENYLRQPPNLASFLQRITSYEQSLALCDFLGIAMPAVADDALNVQVRALVLGLAHGTDMDLKSIDTMLRALMPVDRPLPRVDGDLLGRFLDRQSLQKADPGERRLLARAARELRGRPEDALATVQALRGRIALALPAGPGGPGAVAGKD